MLFFLVPTISMSHPLKMSVANLHYDLETAQYTLDLRMFVDDYLVATGVLSEESKYHPSLALRPNKSSVKAYLQDHLSISFNGQLLDLKVDRVKLEELTIFVIFKPIEALPPNAITTITAEDTIFVDHFFNQRNVLHFDFPDRARRSLLFNQYQRDGMIEW